MRKDVEYRSGGFYCHDKHVWLWPVNDRGAWDWMCMEPHLPSEVVRHVKERSGCIIAGAHAGFYTKQYAHEFNKVLAFEPHPTNFACLVDNVEEDNVTKLQLILSDKAQFYGLKSDDPQNSGGYYVVEGYNYLATTIDSICSSHIGLIHLDVEGHELEVLIGGSETIDRFSPTIVLENTYAKYPLAERFLLDMGYRVAERLRFDSIFVR